jgi:hypothetical protein
MPPEVIQYSSTATHRICGEILPTPGIRASGVYNEQGKSRVKSAFHQSDDDASHAACQCILITINCGTHTKYVIWFKKATWQYQSSDSIKEWAMAFAHYRVRNTRTGTQSDVPDLSLALSTLPSLS